MTTNHAGEIMRINPELKKELEMLVPDKIEFFRLLRRAGRSDTAKAEALEQHFAPFLAWLEARTQETAQ